MLLPAPNKTDGIWSRAMLAAWPIGKNLRERGGELHGTGMHDAHISADGSLFPRHVHGEVFGKQVETRDEKLLQSIGRGVVGTGIEVDAEKVNAAAAGWSGQQVWVVSKLDANGYKAGRVLRLDGSGQTGAPARCVIEEKVTVVDVAAAASVTTARNSQRIEGFARQRIVRPVCRQRVGCGEEIVEGAGPKKGCVAKQRVDTGFRFKLRGVVVHVT